MWQWHTACALSDAMHPAATVPSLSPRVCTRLHACSQADGSETNVIFTNYFDGTDSSTPKALRQVEVASQPNVRAQPATHL
jgi:hypothetical protein